MPRSSNRPDCASTRATSQFPRQLRGVPTSLGSAHIRSKPTRRRSAADTVAEAPAARDPIASYPSSPGAEPGSGHIAALRRHCSTRLRPDSRSASRRCCSSTGAVRAVAVVRGLRMESDVSALQRASRGAPGRCDARCHHCGHAALLPRRVPIAVTWICSLASARSGSSARSPLFPGARVARRA